MRRFFWTAAPLFAGLALIHTWPLGRDASTHTIDFSDGILNNWLLTAVARRLFVHPFTVFDVNMYYPYHHALATLSHQLSTAFLVAPIALLSQDALLPANVFIVASFALAGLMTAVLVADITGSRAAGLFAGCVYAFCPMRLENLNHTHVLGNCWLPLALLTAQRFARAPSWRRLSAATGAFLVLGLASWYYAVMGGIAVAIVGASELVRARPDRWLVARRAIAGGAVIAAVLGAVGWPYVVVSREYLPDPARAFKVSQTPHLETIDRTVNRHVLADLSASVESYVGVAAGARVPWARPLDSVSAVAGSRFFPGVAALAFGALATGLLVRRQLAAFPIAWVTVGLVGWTIFGTTASALDLPMGPILVMRAVPGFFLILACAVAMWLFAPLTAPADDLEMLRSARAFLVVGAIGMLLSFGQEVKAFGVPLGQGIYPATLPPFSLLRAASRFGVLFSLSAAVLAGIGYAFLARRLTRPAARVGVAALVLLGTNAELLAAPIPLSRVERVPEAYEWLRRAPAGPVIDFPIHGNVSALYWSLYHRQPLVNGEGIVVPAPFHRLEEYDDLSPDMLASIRTYFHPRYVVVDRAAYTGEAARRLDENLGRDADELKLLARFGARAIYEIVGPSRGTVVLRSYPASMLEDKRSVAVRARVENAPRGRSLLQVWGNGRLLVTAAASAAANGWLRAPLSASTALGLNLEVMADYALPAEGRLALGRTGSLAPVDIGLTVTPDRTRLQVNGHVWIGEKGYTVAAIDPDGRIVGVRTFNTSWSEDESHALAAYLAGLPPRTIVAVASAFDASRSLTADAVSALAGAGLTGDLRGRFRWAHAGIGVRGAPPGSAIESIGESSAACRIGEPTMSTVALDDVRLE